MCFSYHLSVRFLPTLLEILGVVAREISSCCVLESLLLLFSRLIRHLNLQITWKLVLWCLKQYLLPSEVIEIPVVFLHVFGFSVLPSVASDSRCVPCSASPTLGRLPVTARKPFDRHRCSSAKANVTVPPFPTLKVSFPWRKNLHGSQHSKSPINPPLYSSLHRIFVKVAHMLDYNKET